MEEKELCVRARATWLCPYCVGGWKHKDCYSRCLEIGNKQQRLSILLGPPPEELHREWVKERIEFYKRVEPCAPLRDTKPLPYDSEKNVRVMLRGLEAQQLWQMVLGVPSDDVMKVFNSLSKEQERMLLQ